MVFPQKTMAIDSNWGTASVDVGSTTTVYMSDSFQDILSLSTVHAISFKWSSYNTSVAQVTSQSLYQCTVKGISQGTVRINCHLYYRVDGVYVDKYETVDGYITLTVKQGNVYVTSVSLSSSSASLKVGETKQLSATVLPSNATNKSVSWSTSSSSVASVSSSGLVTAKASGTATITCKANDGSGKQATCFVTVTAADPVKVTGISLNYTSTAMIVGDTRQLSATISPSNATDKTVSWSSSNSSVASVSSSGLVTAKANGTATITCKANDGSGKQATCTVSVSSVKSWSRFTAKTKEGVEMRFYVGDISKGVCMVDYGYNNPAVDVNTTGAITIPSEVEGLKVTEINGYAFYKCTGITSVSIPSSVETIGSSAFSDCTGLTSVSLGNGVKRLGSSAFYGCSSLTSITGISQLEYIGSQAFNITYNSTYIPWYNSLPDGPLYLGKVLFKYKGTMPDNTTFDIKEGTTMIGYQCFNRQDGLVGVNIPQSVNTIDSYAFGNCPNLISMKVASGNNTFDSRNSCNAIVRTADNAIVVGCKSTTFPSSVTAIGSHAFYGSVPEEVVIPNNIDSIAYGAFYFCDNLKSVIIGKGTRKIETKGWNGHAFFYCLNLKSISVATTNPYLDSRDNCNAIIDKATDRLIAGCSTTIIPKSVKIIGSDAFENYRGIYSITLPGNVEEVEYRAFEVLTDLHSLVLDKKLKYIRKEAFSGCGKLRTIHTLASEPAEMDETAFQYNSSKPDSIYNNATLYVPIGSKVNYMTTAGWNKFKKIVEIADDVEPEGTVFTANTTEGLPLWYMITDANAKTCKLIGSPTDISGKVTLPARPNGYSLTSIGANSFYAYNDERKITEVVIPEGVTTLENYALYCRHKTISSISLPTTLTSIGNYAFEYSSMRSINIPKNTTQIGYGIFYGCEKLETITVDAANSVYESPSGSNAIIEMATSTLIAGCKNTKIPDYVVSIGKSALSKVGLSNITIPESVVFIGSSALSSNGFSTITIPSHVTSLGTYAFASCRELTSVYSLIMEPFDIDPLVFSNWNSTDQKYYFTDATLYVPVGTKAKYQATEGWNQFNNIVEYTPDDDPTITTKGDVNGDQLVNGTDLVALSNIVLGRRDKVAAADVNGDGNVNGTDIVALSNIILGKTTAKAKAKAMSIVNANAGASLSIEPFSINAGEEKEMLIDLNNANDEVTLVQFDMKLPAGLSIKKVGSEYDFDIAGRTTWRKHTLDANETEGAVRFLMYSSNSTAIEGTSGAIISVKLVADASYRGGKIILANTLLVSPNEKETKPADYEYDLGGGSVTPDDGSAKLSIERFTINAGEEKEMLIDLNNANDEVTLVQFDMKLPAGLSIKKVGGEYDFDIAGRTTWRKHTLDANETEGAVRFLMYSSNSTAIDGTSGAIISVKLVADSNFRQAGSKIVLSNILLVSPNEKDTKPVDYTYSLDGTGIKMVTADDGQQTPIFSLSGQRLEKPRKGINIIGGKKVVVK